MQAVLKATDVRQNWGGFIDGVVRRGPEFVKRNRDCIAALSMDHLKAVLNPYVFHLECAKEADGSVSGSLREIDVVANAPTEADLRLALAAELVEYAEEYIGEYATYARAPNRKQHFPFVLRVLIQPDEASVARLINA